MVFDPVPVFVDHLERRIQAAPQRPFVADRVAPVRPQQAGGIGGEQILLDRGERRGFSDRADLGLQEIEARREIPRDFDRLPRSGGEFDLPVDAGDAVAPPVEQAAADRDLAGSTEAEIAERDGHGRLRRMKIRLPRAVEPQQDPIVGRDLRGHAQVVHEQPAGVGRGQSRIDGEVDAERIVRREDERRRLGRPVRGGCRQLEANLTPARPIDADGVLEFAVGSRQEEVPLDSPLLGDPVAITHERIEQHARAVAVHPDGQIDRHAGQRGIDRHEPALGLGPPLARGLAPRDLERPLAAVRVLLAGAGRARARRRGISDLFSFEAEVAAIHLEVGDEHAAVGAGEHQFPGGGDRAVGLVERGDLQREGRESARRGSREAGERKGDTLRLAGRQCQFGPTAPELLAVAIEQGPLHLGRAGRGQRGILDGGRGVGGGLPLVGRIVVGELDRERGGGRLLRGDLDRTDLDRALAARLHRRDPQGGELEGEIDLRSRAVGEVRAAAAARQRHLDVAPVGEVERREFPLAVAGAQPSTLPVIGAVGVVEKEREHL